MPGALTVTYSAEQHQKARDFIAELSGDEVVALLIHHSMIEERHVGALTPDGILLIDKVYQFINGRGATCRTVRVLSAPKGD